jgi:hypothetical protein
MSFVGLILTRNSLSRMHRSIQIVLTKPAAPLPPEPNERLRLAGHWRRWREGGAVLSVLLHAAVLTLLTLAVPVLGGPAMPERQTAAIPVEVVPPPEPKPEEKKEEEKPEAKKEEEKKKPEPPDVQKQPPPNLELPKPDLPKPDVTPELAKPEPPKLGAQPPSPAGRTAPPPPPRPRAAAAPKPAPPPPAGFPAAKGEPPPSEPASPPPAPSSLPEAKLPAAPPPLPAEPPPPGLKVDADDDAAPPPNPGKNELGYWVLEPVTVNLGHKCGLARLSGALELKQKVSEGVYRGTLRTRIAWTSCPPEGVLRQVELRIRGGEVEMVGTGGFVDRGVIGQKTMLLEDSFGRSVWKKR